MADLTCTGGTAFAPPSSTPAVTRQAAGSADAVRATTNASANWADGDVLRLQLRTGRSVYAEVLGPSRRPSQQVHSQQSTQQRRSAAVAAATEGTLPQAAPLLFCQGARYTLQRTASHTESHAAATAEDRGARQQHDAEVLTCVGGALPPSEPLLTAPPKQHAATLRAWAPLASRLARPPPPAAPAPAPAPAPGEVPVPVAEVAADRGGASQQAANQARGSLDGAAVVGCERVGGVAELRAMAAAQPGVWCDGTGPSDPPLSDDARALYTAGELACLLEGHRGVVLLQLHVGWDEHDAVPPYGPYKPLVLRLLREALSRPDVVSFASAVQAPGGPPGGSGAAGLTMVLCADKEPFRSWGAHLASFGCQAALEAQSPYYKLLVGRILGYKPANVAHYIKAKHGSEPSAEVVAAVEQQLSRLSPKQPRLPWNASSRGGGRKKAKQVDC